MSFFSANLILATHFMLNNFVAFKHFWGGWFFWCCGGGHGGKGTKAGGGGGGVEVPKSKR